jgi:hypothetical protein
MGLFGNLFGGESAMRRATKKMQRAYAAERTTQAGNYETLAAKFADERAKNADVYSKQYNESIKQYADTMAQSRAAFGAASAESFKTLSAGRDATLALLQQSTDKAVGQSTAQGLLMGLSNTTFGQSQVQSVARQGALQAGAVNEQYAQILAAAQQSTANSMANMEAQAGQTTLSAGLGAANYLGNQYQGYTQGQLQTMQTGYQRGENLGVASISGTYQQQQASAQSSINAGNQLGGALVGAAAGAVGNMILPGVGGMIGSGLAGAALGG